MNLLANDRAASGEFGSGLAEFEPPVDFELEAKPIIISSKKSSKKNLQEDKKYPTANNFRHHHHSKVKYYGLDNEAIEEPPLDEMGTDTRPISRSIRHLGSPRRGDFPQSHRTYPVFEEADTSTLEVEFEADIEELPEDLPEDLAEDVAEDSSGECDFTIIFDDGGQQPWLHTGERILSTILHKLRECPKVYVRVLRTSWKESFEKFKVQNSLRNVWQYFFFKAQKKQNFIFLYSGNILDVPLEKNNWNFNRTTGDVNEIPLEISRFGKNPHLPPVIISPKGN